MNPILIEDAKEIIKGGAMSVRESILYEYYTALLDERNSEIIGLTKDAYAADEEAREAENEAYELRGKIKEFKVRLNNIMEEL